LKTLEYRWLETSFSALLAMRARLPHAMLLVGPPGIGKRALAEHFAQALLCESPHTSGHPCGQCGACRWFTEGNHPDYRAVIPEVLQPDPELAAAADEGAVPEPGTARSKAAPSKVIKIGQIRALDSFFNVGTHRAGRRLLLVYPADALNTDAANALLKVLEEPPQATHFLLVTSRPSDVLPTIRSRCARMTIGQPDTAMVMTWLQEQGVQDPLGALAEAGGAPLDAAMDKPHADFHDILIGALCAARPVDPVVLAEKCEKAGASNVVLWLSRWVSDLLRCGSGGKVRYHPKQAAVLAGLAGSASAPALLAYYRKLMRQRRVAEHPLNSRLYTEDLLIDYARLIAPRT
jgi:DNA polymerase-3 subunit delta'